MGKAEDEQAISAGDAQILPESGEANASRACRCHRLIGRTVRPRCVAALLLGVSVLLSAIFWLPPFVHVSRDRDDSDRFGADIIASFRLNKPASFLNDNTVQLQYDIFAEIGVLDSYVSIIYLEPMAGLNWTTVFFAVFPYPNSSTISSTGLSILRSSFMSLVIGQSTLGLTTSLFGNSSFFQVLRFPGGITIIPPQNVFPLQQVHWLFNFTLLFPIFEVEPKVNQLEDQMKLGLLLNSYESLYVRLINTEGSTVDPPTIVQTAILLEVGNDQPSLPRLKQLAQTIKNSTGGNLGLNHTVFGKVKQIRLSSFLQHSLSSASSASGSPSPAPQPHNHMSHHDHHHHHRHHRNHRHHQHHHHPHHHHHSEVRLVPPPPALTSTPAPAPAPAPVYSSQRPPPAPRCQFGSSIKQKCLGHSSSAVSPAASANISPSAMQQHDPPSSSPKVHRLSPLSAVYFAHAQPPSRIVENVKPHVQVPSVSPRPEFSFAAANSLTSWIFALFLYLSLHL